MSTPDQEPVYQRIGVGREAADRRVRLVALLASLAIHAILIVLYSLTASDWSAFTGRVSIEAPSEASLDGTRIVNITEIETLDPTVDEPIFEEEEEEDEPEAPVLLVSLLPAVGGDERVAVGLPDPISAAEVFRARIVDPTLWMVARPDLLILTPAQRMQLQLEGRLEAWNDSLRSSIAAETALLDWTKTDGKGGRWGISPGKLHLGKITLPLPFGFGPNPWQAEQIANRRARDDDILNHVQGQAVRASWKERAEAIRQRKERERAIARQRENRSDTTRSRRGGR